MVRQEPAQILKLVQEYGKYEDAVAMLPEEMVDDGEAQIAEISQRLEAVESVDDKRLAEEKAWAVDILTKQHEFLKQVWAN